MAKSAVRPLVVRRYRPLGLASRGAQGEVYSGVDTWTQQPVALKFSTSDIDTTFSEYEVLSRLRHRGLVSVLDVGRIDGRGVLVEPWLDGTPLGQAELDIEARARCLAPVADGLALLHRHELVHGDVSPNNVMTDKAGVAAVLLDLGHARRIGEMPSGTTPGFAAPEVFTGSGLTTAADIYSMARCIVGVQGEEGPLSPSLLTPRLAELLRLCLSDEPRARPSARVLSAVLHEELGLPVPDTQSQGVSFVGRDDELRAGLQWLSGTDPVLEVFGAKGTGKSEFLRALGRQLRLAGSHVLGPISQPQDVLASLIYWLGPDKQTRLSPSRDLEELLDDLIDRVGAELEGTGQSLLVLVDDEGSRDEFVRRLRERVLAGVARGRLRIVAVTTSISPNVPSIFVGPLDDLALATMSVRCTGRELSVERLRQLVQRFGRLPAVWSQLVYRLENVGTSDGLGIVLTEADTPWTRLSAYVACVPGGVTYEQALVIAEALSSNGSALGDLNDALAVGALTWVDGRIYGRNTGADIDREVSMSLARELSDIDAPFVALVFRAFGGDELTDEQVTDELVSDVQFVRLCEVLHRGGCRIGRKARAAWLKSCAQRGDLEQAQVAAEGHSHDHEFQWWLANVDYRAARYDEAIGRCADLSAHPDVQALVFETLFASGRHHELEALLDSAVHPRARVIAAHLLARRSPQEAVASYEALLVSSDLVAADKARHGLAIAHHRLGNYERAASEYIECVRVAAGASKVRRLSNLASVFQDAGDWQKAQDTYEKAWEIGERLGNRAELVHVGINLANLRVRLGEVSLAADLSLLVAGWAEAMGMKVATIMARLVALEAAIERGSGAEVDRLIPELENLVDSAADTNAKAELALLRCERHRLAGDTARARSALDAVELSGVDRDLSMRLNLARAGIATTDDDLAKIVGALELSLDNGNENPEVRWRLWAARTRLAGLAGEQGLETHRQQALVCLEAWQQTLGERLSAGYLSVPSCRRWFTYVMPLVSQSLSVANPVGQNLKRLAAVNRRLARESDPERLVASVVDAAIDLMGAERGFLLLHRKGSLEVVTSRRFDGQQASMTGFSRTLAQKVIDQGAAIFSDDAQADFGEVMSIGLHRSRSLLCAPIYARSPQGPVSGALYLDHRFQERVFGPSDANLVEAFADQAAIALNNAWLLDHIRAQEAALHTRARQLQDVNSKLLVDIARFAEEAESARRRLGRQLELETESLNFVGSSSAIQKTSHLVRRFGASDVPVIVCGESGVGKEKVARAIHDNGARRSGPFVAVNCGAIVEQLFESEVFGHKRGAFTGAIQDKLGLVDVAQGGTLFFDEIGELSLNAQTKLLRLIQAKEYTPVGGDEVRHADVRFLSASHRDIEAMVEAGTMREDLFYRLAVARIDVPPLRERREDIPALLNELCQRHCGAAAQECISPGALRALVGYDWPGNIRELENELMRSWALSDGAVLVSELSPKVQPSANRKVVTQSYRGVLKEVMATFEGEVIKATLERLDWNVQQAARELGLSRAALYTRLTKYKIKRDGSN